MRFPLPSSGSSDLIMLIAQAWSGSNVKVKSSARDFTLHRNSHHSCFYKAKVDAPSELKQWQVVNIDAPGFYFLIFPMPQGWLKMVEIMAPKLITPAFFLYFALKYSI